MPTVAPRTLADQLRSWPDERLGALLRARPDLASPAPQDSSHLASRASTRASVLRALDGLDRLELLVVEAVTGDGGRAGAARLREVVNADGSAVDRAVERLRAMALLWGELDDLRVVGAVAESLGPSPARLGPPAEQLLSHAGPDRVASLLADLGARSSGDRAADVRRIAEVLADASRVEGLVADAGDDARQLLAHLEESGSEGATDRADLDATVATAGGPAERLLARGLLVARDRRHLAVPREVAMSLRGGRTTRERADLPPELRVSSRPARLVDQAAAGAAYELVHRVELLLDHWGEEPPSVLRQGGLAVRDLKATAALLHAAEPVAALVVETAAAAGLLAQGDTDRLDAAWLPTDTFDLWRDRSLAERWATLASAWLDGDRPSGLVGDRTAGRVVNALAPDLERPWLPATRREALGEVAALPEGTVLATSGGVASLVERMRWLRPRRPAARDDAVAWALTEAAVIGVMGLGGVCTPGRELLASGTTAAAEAVEPLLPSPVDHVLLQADLTAVAPGPLERDLARDLATVAHVESRGGATVYRFTESSVRHAFDAGWSTAEVVDLVTRAARTEVPQPLRYLVEDVARTFGTVRLGSASAFLRSDDEAALAALVHDPRAAALRLRRIAPTVVVSDAPVDVLLARLRELGVAPVVEGPDGVVRLDRRAAHRARPARRHPRLEAARTARDSVRVAATVTAVRAGDRVAQVRPASAAERTSPASTLATLREAAEAESTVLIDYVDSDGSLHERVVDPQRVEGGRLSAYDHRSEETRSYAVHRIKGVRRL